jgi:glyoxylase-like metal-dependent hydrolase (beta-lactamase superfamily II)
VRIARTVVGPLATNCYLVTTAAGRGVLVDPGAAPERLRPMLAGVTLDAILLTHAHWDHVQAVDALRERFDVPVAAHAAEAEVWAGECEHLRVHGHWDWALAADQRPPDEETPSPGWDGTIDVDLAAAGEWDLGPVAVEVIPTPGHSPGSVSFLVGDQLLTGDTLFPGGPGLTGWPLSDFPTIIDSIEHRLFTLPGPTVVRPGHGAPTTIGAERPHLDDWRARGW